MLALNEARKGCPDLMGPNGNYDEGENFKHAEIDLKGITLVLYASICADRNCRYRIAYAGHSL